MELIIAGDFYLSGRLANVINPEEIVLAIDPSIRSLIQSADFSFVNFEGASSGETKGILKDGPCLKIPEVGIVGLKSAGFNAITLANNHVGDYSSKGVTDTIRRCDKNGMLHAGAGKDISEAASPLIIGDMEKIAVINICESEALIATPSTAGTAPIDLINLFYLIRDLRDRVSFILVIAHGGCEHFPLPTPEMKKRFHFLIDAGADAVVNHHQHCYCGYEEYNGKPIFYGTGNFLFDNMKSGAPWNYGYMVKLTTNNEPRFEIIPYHQCEEKPIVELLDSHAFDKELKKLNSIITDDDLLEREFDRLVRDKKPLSVFLPYSNHYLTELYLRGYLPSFTPKKKLAKMLSRIKCETHTEILRRKFSPDFSQEQ